MDDDEAVKTCPYFALIPDYEASHGPLSAATAALMFAELEQRLRQ